MASLARGTRPVRASPLSVKQALACTPDTKDRFFTQCKKQYSVLLVQQKGADLGARMKNLFCWAFSRGFQRVVMIGSDAPTIPASFIKEAFSKLKTMPIVLGPAMDGGYYLIGRNARRACCPDYGAKLPFPDIFSDIRWGSHTVLSETITRLSRHHLLPFWYDVDYQEDIDFLRRHLSILTKRKGVLPIETLKFINKMKSRK